LSVLDARLQGMTNLLLRTDADGERACDILRDLANEAGNARSGNMYERYIAWTEDAERMLGKHR
jgi:protein involved in temperature-dependent protein secretion